MSNSRVFVDWACDYSLPCNHSPLLNFNATSMAWPQLGCLFVGNFMLPFRFFRKKLPAWLAFTLQHFRNPSPFSSSSRLKRRPNIVAVISRSYVLRVWLPSQRFWPLEPLGNLFQFPTLLGFALQSFAPFRWSDLCFHRSFRSCTSLQNHPGLVPVLQRLHPIWKAVPLFAP